MNPEEIEAVREILQTSAGRGRLITLAQIQATLGRAVARSEWHLLLDPIYRDVRITRGLPDLTCIVLRGGNGEDAMFPAFFSDGGPARSVPFNPDVHMARWIEETERVFATRW
jgi:hypothetical protein